MSLTGRFNFRRTWRGGLNLEIEEDVHSRWGGEKRRWRKATLADLAEPEMRALMDLRVRPQFAAYPRREDHLPAEAVVRSLLSRPG